VKYRGPFRPFAPSALLDRAGEYFASDYPSPVMLHGALTTTNRALNRAA
jgi:predicted NodU family carbamoyl transferase